jgi:hypothetical protein
MKEEPMKVVRLTRRYERQMRENQRPGLYNVGELVGLNDDEADRLIAAGAAVEVSKDEGDNDE